MPAGDKTISELVSAIVKTLKLTTEFLRTCTDVHNQKKPFEVVTPVMNELVASVKDIMKHGSYIEGLAAGVAAVAAVTPAGAPAGQ